MALAFEMKFNGTDWSLYDFHIVKPGIVGRHIPPIRRNRENIPGVDDPLDFGSDYGTRIITVHGAIKADDHDKLLEKISNIGGQLDIATYAYKKLQFGDLTTGNCCYEAVYNGTFIVKHLGSSLTSATALVTIGFDTKYTMVAA